MIAALPHAEQDTLKPDYLAFLEALNESGFAGEITPDAATRTLLGTDNSIYQRMPQAAVFPRHQQDIECVARLAGQPEFRHIVLAARGGGTGTNGQSLTDGIVVDISRHMNQILDIDIENRRVRVQAGVVKDQLNAALKPHGLFFAPELSTSNRATIGGMINTDASGQGSCTYGKTRDHVIDVGAILIGGETLRAGQFDAQQTAELIQGGGRRGALVETAQAVIDQHGEAISERFPPLNRCLTGYDLAHLRSAQGLLDIRSLFCGAEGSLGFIADATLNVLPLPQHSALVNIRYEGFMDALRDAEALMHGEIRPTSIETVDSKVLGLAMNDFIWDKVVAYFPSGDTPTAGINLVEFNAESEAELKAHIETFSHHLEDDATVIRLGHTIAWGRSEMSAIYAMRKRSVGLLGNVEGEQRPIPFVEDTAVPPEVLADYIAEFRDLLDSHGLGYGMFGHVDAGVLHVRPAIDMKDPDQARLIRVISDGVAELTHRYGGLLWGEHGKGVRSEYAPRFFGSLYPLLQRIKGACDANNQLNPGKIATPLVNDVSQHTGQTKPQSHWQLLKIDEVPTRGERDRRLDSQVWQHFGAAMHCNGNGACYNYDPDDAMCPSWKGTRDRIHSPKGRAQLFKEWLVRQQDTQGALPLKRADSGWQQLTRLPGKLVNHFRKEQEQDFSHQVYDAMAGCLACKSCAGQCPVKVSVPDFRAEFLSLYHGRYLRSPRDHLVASIERLVPLLSRTALFYNALSRWRPLNTLMAKTVGLVDMPAISRAPLKRQLASWGIQTATPQHLQGLTSQQKENTLILVQDAFTSFFDTAVVRDIIEFLQRLGITVLVAPYSPNGKPLQVHGFLDRFQQTAHRQSKQLSQLAKSGVALVGIDPAMTLVYRQEYRKAVGSDAPEVELLQEWLLKRKERLAQPLVHAHLMTNGYRLLGHCTEKTTAAGSQEAWQQLFDAFGLSLSIEKIGCCGMSGTYGHEARNVATSQQIYGLSWQSKVEQRDANDTLLATGYSCRSQVKRFSQTRLEHPLQALLRAHKIAHG